MKIATFEGRLCFEQTALVFKGHPCNRHKIYLGVDPCNGFSKAFRTTSPVINENNVQNTINLQYDIRMDIINGINHSANDVTT